MKKSKWLYVEPLGQLFVEEVLISSNEPALFVCLDDEGKKYLTVLLDDEEEAYLMVQTTDALLLSMLKNEVSMDKTFRAAVNGVAFCFAYQQEQKKHVCHIENIKNVPASDLPDSDVMFELRNAKILEYINFLQDEEIHRKSTPKYTARITVSECNAALAAIAAAAAKSAHVVKYSTKFEQMRTNYEKKQLSSSDTARADQALLSA